MSNETVAMMHVSSLSQEDRAEYCHRINHNYSPLIGALQASVDKLVSGANGVPVLIKTDYNARELWDEYLNSFTDPALRQENNCQCCRHFFYRWANVAVLDASGELKPLLFSVDDEQLAAMPEEYRTFFSKKLDLSKTRMSHPVYSSELFITAGRAESNGFTHLNLTIGPVRQVRYIARTLYSNVAETMEDVRLLRQALIKFQRPYIKRVGALITHNPRTNEGQFVEPIVKFGELADLYDQTKSKIDQHNLLMRTVLFSSKGLARIGQGLIGTLLHDLQDGTNEDVAWNQFVQRARPETYMRPTAEPSIGAIDRAEKIFAEMNLGDSLQRRALRRDELPDVIWQPAVVETTEEKKGLFDSVRPDTAAKPSNAAIDGGAISAKSLVAKMLSGEITKLVYIPDGHIYGMLCHTTAVHQEATPILRWDNAEDRYPISCYTYTNGSPASDWGLTPGKGVEVVAMTPIPQDRAAYKKTGEVKAADMIFVLAEGRDTNPHPPLALFPASMRPDLFEVRSVIERYSMKNELAEPENGFAAIQVSIPNRQFLATYKDGTQVRLRIMSVE